MNSRKDHFETLALALLVLMGAYVRLIHIIPLNFPLNDGGAFYQMIIELQKTNYALPVFTTYNLKDIPYAYPPLAFYVGGFLSDFFDWPVLEILRVFPAMVSILTIPAFYILSKRILKSRSQVLWGTFGFTFLPPSFDWLIVGGGMTRSLGYLFAILTLGQAYALYTNNSRRHLFLTILFASLTILSHPGTAWFAFYCTAIILLFTFKSANKWFLKSIFVIVGIVTLTAPWWYTQLNRHGISIFTSPFMTESPSLASFITPFTFLFTNEPFLDILAFCGLFGVLISIKNRAFFLPIWLLSIFIFESRLGTTYSVIPMSMSIGVGIDQGILAVLYTNKDEKPKKYPRLLPNITAGYFIAYAFIAAYLGINYHVVSVDQITAMGWIRAHSPLSSQFLVLSGTPEYGIDPVSEWFPALSQRTSLTTPQLHEWLSGGEFTKRIKIHAELQVCADQDLACVETWADQRAINFSHIYIPDSSPFKISTNLSPDFKIVYDGQGGAVIEKISPEDSGK